MKKNKIYIVLSIFGFFLSWNASAQSENAQNKLNDFDLLLPPVEELVDSAMARNGMLSYRKLDIKVRETDLKTKKRLWSQNMGLRGDLRYGTFNNFISTDDGASNTAFSTLSQQINYGIGLYIQLPIFDVWNRRNEAKRAKVQIKQAQSLVTDQELIIREEVIRQYEDVQLKYELLKIQAVNFGNARVNMEMVDKEFRNGQLPVYEYVRLSDITARIQSEYEKAKTDYHLSKKVLENTTGIIIK